MDMHARREKGNWVFCNRPLQPPETNSEEHPTPAPSPDSRALAQLAGCVAERRNGPSREPAAPRMPPPARCSTALSCSRRTRSCSKTKNCSSASPSAYTNGLDGRDHLSWLKPQRVKNPCSQLPASGKADRAPSGSISPCTGLSPSQGIIRK